VLAFVVLTMLWGVAEGALVRWFYLHKRWVLACSMLWYAGSVDGSFGATDLGMCMCRRVCCCSVLELDTLARARSFGDVALLHLSAPGMVAMCLVFLLPHAGLIQKL